MLDNHNTHNNLYNIYIQDCRKLNVTDQSIFNTLNNLYDKQIKINLIISKEGSQVKSNFFNNETTSRIISIVKTFALRIWQSRGKVVYKIDQTLKIFGDRAFLDNLYKVPCIIMYKISEKFLCRNQVGLKNPLKKSTASIKRSKILFLLATKFNNNLLSSFGPVLYYFYLNSCI